MLSVPTPLCRGLLSGAAVVLVALCSQPVWARPVAPGPSSALPGRAAPASRSAALPSRLLFVPTGAETIDIYDLDHPNQHGVLGQISSGLVSDQYQMTTDAAGDLFVVNDNFNNPNQEYVAVYAPPYTGTPTILNGVLFPLGVAVDGTGTVFVSNCGAYCFQTPTIYEYEHGSTTPTGSLTAPGFSSLGGLAADKAGNLYVGSGDRSTGASSVFLVAAGSSTVTDLHLKGLFNLGGPGTPSVALDRNGDIYAGNNSNSMYVLAFHPHATTAYRIIDPFSFFDVPGMIDYGPDGKLYVPVNCGNNSCEGAVVGFAPKNGRPVVAVGAPGPNTAGVATFPNVNLAGRTERTPAAYLHPAPLRQLQAVQTPLSMLTNVAATQPRASTHRPLLGAPGRHVVAQRGGGWISPAAKRQHLLYLSVTGNGSTSFGSVNIYPAAGQSQAPLGQITDGIATPEGIGTDHAGNLYVANSSANTVTVYKPGQKNASTTYTNGIGTPYDVKVGGDGTVYVANAFAPVTGVGSVTEYPAGSTNPSITLSNGGLNAISVSLDKTNNLYVAWYSLSGAFIEVDKYAPGSTSGTNLGLDLPAPCFPAYGMAVDHGNNLVLWYESLDLSVNYLATFAPGATEPSHSINGGSFLHIVTGIAFGRSTDAVYVSTPNVNKEAKLMYPRGLPLDVIGLDAVEGVALSPGT